MNISIAWAYYLALTIVSNVMADHASVGTLASEDIAELSALAATLCCLVQGKNPEAGTAAMWQVVSYPRVLVDRDDLLIWADRVERFCCEARNGRNADPSLLRPWCPCSMDIDSPERVVTLSLDGSTPGPDVTDDDLVVAIHGLCMAVFGAASDVWMTTPLPLFAGRTPVEMIGDGGARSVFVLLASLFECIVF